MFINGFGRRRLYTNGNFPSAFGGTTYSYIEGFVRERTDELILEHSRRAADYALELNCCLRQRGNPQLVALGALLHDIGWPAVFTEPAMLTHSADGARIIRSELTGVLSPEVLDQVAFIAYYHSPWERAENPTPELKVVYDGEKLEFLQRRPDSRYRDVVLEFQYFRRTKAIMLFREHLARMRQT